MCTDEGMGVGHCVTGTQSQITMYIMVIKLKIIKNSI